GAVEDVQGLAGGEVPDVDRVVGVGAGEQAAVAGDGQGGHLGRVAVEQDDRLQRLRVPDAGGRVPPGGDQVAAVGVPDQGRDAVGVADQGADVLPRAHVPKADGLALPGGREDLAIDTERKGADGALVQVELVQELVGGGVPVTNGAVVVARRQEGLVGGEGDGGNPVGLGDGGQEVARGGVPDGQVVAGGGEHAGVGAEGPEVFEVAGRVPGEFLAGDGVPAADEAGILDRPEGAVGGEGQGEEVAVGVQLRGAEDQDTRDGVGGGGGASHETLSGQGADGCRAPPRVLLYVKLYNNSGINGGRFAQNLSKKGLPEAFAAAGGRKGGRTDTAGKADASVKRGGTGA